MIMLRQKALLVSLLTAIGLWTAALAAEPAKLTEAQEARLDRAEEKISDTLDKASDALDEALEALQETYDQQSEFLSDSTDSAVAALWKNPEDDAAWNQLNQLRKDADALRKAAKDLRRQARSLKIRDIPKSKSEDK